MNQSRFSNFFRNPEGELVVVQQPNAAILIFVAGRVLSYGSEGDLELFFRYVGNTALIIWALLELVDGDSPFRRLLGLMVLAVLAWGYLS